MDSKGTTRESLPCIIKLPSDFSVSAITEYVSELKAFLASPLVDLLVSAHPNEVAIKGQLTPTEVHDAQWWKWVGDVDPSGRAGLINALIRSAADQTIQEDQEFHPSIRRLVHQVSRLRLPRALEDVHDGLSGLNGHRNSGMSPKKAHEVERLSNLIDMIYDTSVRDPNRLIVDVGAGQGYLSRKLAEHTSTRVLALDGDEGQTEGATLRGKGLSHAERQRARNQQDLPGEGGTDPMAPPVTHRTLFITSDSLLHAMDEWIEHLDVDQRTTPRPVLITGLHACGSLTPAVLRCFIDLYTQLNQEASNKRKWTPVALALVGCCYNLMHDSGDFPLSETTARVHPQTGLHLTQNHLQLAAQCPAQWSRSPSEAERASLARRKIVWRAMLARLFHNNLGGSSTNAPPNRLGRLPDRVYVSWEIFVRTACEKMGLTATDTERLLIDNPLDENRSALSSETDTLSFQLEVLHILRALIGPVIESLIIVDRAIFLAERLGSGNGQDGFTVRVLNIFDQLSSGSARNIALVVEPISN